MFFLYDVSFSLLIKYYLCYLLFKLNRILFVTYEKTDKWSKEFREDQAEENEQIKIYNKQIITCMIT